MKKTPVGTFVIGAPSLSSGKGKSNFSPEIVEAQLLMGEYRHALIDGLGSNGKGYKIACIPRFAGITNAGVAVSLEDHMAYVLIDGTGGQLTEYLPALLAKDVTAFLQTRAVPAQSSAGRIYWGGQQRGPIVAYQFKLVELPNRLPF